MGPTEVGSGLVREQEAPPSELIDIINDRFGTDFNDADQLFFDQIVETAMADETLRKAAPARQAPSLQASSKRAHKGARLCERVRAGAHERCDALGVVVVFLVGVEVVPA